MNDIPGLNANHRAILAGDKCLGYGKLSSWERITERADAILIAASGSHVRASDDSVRIDDEHSRRLPVGNAHHRIDLDRRAQFGGQRVIALNGIPAAAVAERSSISDEHHPASADDREALRVIQGYGKLCSSNPHIHVAELFGEEPELLTRTVVPSVDPDVRAVFACLRVLDVEHESVFVCDCPIGFHPRAGKPYRLRRLTADQEYRRANRVDLVYGKLLKVDFHDSACDSHFGANEQVNGPVRRDRYLD